MMSENHKQIAVIGGGSWATALVKILTTQDHVVNWWMFNEASAEHLLKFKHNPKYLQSIEFDLDKINASDRSLAERLYRADKAQKASNGRRLSSASDLIGNPALEELRAMTSLSSILPQSPTQGLV